MKELHTCIHLAVAIFLAASCACAAETNPTVEAPSEKDVLTTFSERDIQEFWRGEEPTGPLAGLKVGNVSKPVMCPGKGSEFAVLKIVAKRDGTTTPLEEVRDNIYSRLWDDLADTRMLREVHLGKNPWCGMCRAGRDVNGQLWHRAQHYVERKNIHQAINACLLALREDRLDSHYGGPKANEKGFYPEEQYLVDHGMDIVRYYVGVMDRVQRGHQVCVPDGLPYRAAHIKDKRIVPALTRLVANRGRWCGNTAHALAAIKENPAIPVLKDMLSDRHLRIIDLSWAGKEAVFAQYHLRASARDALRRMGIDPGEVKVVVGAVEGDRLPEGWAKGPGKTTVNGGYGYHTAVTSPARPPNGQPADAGPGDQVDRTNIEFLSEGLFQGWPQKLVRPKPGREFSVHGILWNARKYRESPSSNDLVICRLNRRPYRRQVFKLTPPIRILPETSPDDAPDRSAYLGPYFIEGKYTQVENALGKTLGGMDDALAPLRWKRVPRNKAIETLCQRALNRNWSAIVEHRWKPSSIEVRPRESRPIITLAGSLNSLKRISPELTHIDIDGDRSLYRCASGKQDVPGAYAEATVNVFCLTENRAPKVLKIYVIRIVQALE